MQAKKGWLIANPFEKSGSPSWARTNDLRINSPSLYQLSYRGKEAEYFSFFSDSGQTRRAV
jgi:hypothetical protein